MNYKIKVNVDIEELISLFSALGCKYFNHTVTEKNYMIVEDGKAFFCKLKSDFKKSECKEISIDQLKDMVVLKRNDPKDATHENSHGQSLLKVSNGWYIFNTLLDVWEWNGEYLGYQPIKLKPITKEPVIKEFLVKSQDGKWRLETEVVGDPGDDIIEVPEGAEVAFQASSNSTVVFKRSECGYSNAAIVWQRETLNDKVASAEVARQEFIGVPFLDLPEFNFEAVDDFVESNVEQGAKHPHYKKDISHLDTLDIYRVTELFNPHSCGAHIAKKALCSGQRGHKDLLTDIQDIIDTAERWKEMLIEDEKAK